MALLIGFVQLINRWLVPDAHPVLMPVSLVLNGLGYVMISRISTAVPSAKSEVGQQVVWTVLGVIIYASVLFFVKRSRELERYRYLMLGTTLLLLLLPLAPKLGSTSYNVYGAKLWIQIGPLSVQPVEFAKLLLVIFFASYMNEKRELLTLPTKRLGNHLVPDLRAFSPVVLAGLLSLLIIVAERDIGFPVILFVVFLTMLWTTTGRVAHIAIGVLAGAIAVFIASRLLRQVDERFAIWLNPFNYLTGPQLGYQPVQGELALARGGLFGTGLGLGSGAGVVPVPTSDFIFSIIGEELGLTGAMTVVVAYVLLIACGIHTALNARSEFARLLTMGLTATLGFQSFFILAGVLRLLPLTGVTLPFISYGGSSLLSSYVLLALLMRLSDEGNLDADA